MVMSEQAGGIAMHHHGLVHPHHQRVQPSLVMNPHPMGLNIGCTGQNKKSHMFSHCVGCGGQIHDQYILRVAPDMEWHAACLKCQECNMFLDENCTCFVREGKTYCKPDYVKLFGTKCEKCGRSFHKDDFVMRAKSKIYHIECFRCCQCARHLVPGDEFALREGGALYCKEDHDVIEGQKGGPPATPHPVGPENNNNNTNLSNNNSNSTELGCISDSGSESGSHKGGNGSSSLRGSKASSGLSGGGGGGGGGGGVGGGGGDGKPTRVRTVLNEKQLHTLRTCYAANPRPDALMKEQLVEMTGLSPRVIRVWFQNKRCKDKKKTILMKQQMQQEKDGRKLGYGAMQGIPMVASSPVRHDSPIGVYPLEVQTYQPPWKALHDFALHSDLDQPQQPTFQHLMNQMHGYDLPPPALGGPPPGAGSTHPGALLGAPPPDSMTHPDSTDGYVLESESLNLESDDSLTGSP